MQLQLFAKYASNNQPSTSTSTSELLLLLPLLLLLRALPGFLTEEPVGGCTEVQKAWQACTFGDFGQRSSGQHGRVMGCAGLGFGGVRAGGILPVEAAVGHKTVPSAYFRCRGACTSYDPKAMLAAKSSEP